MAIKDIFKINRKTFFDPRAWLGYDSVKEETQSVWSIFKTIFRAKPISAEHEESFEEAMKRLSLNEEDIHRIGQSYLSYALSFLVLGIAVGGFSIFLLLSGHFLDFFLGSAVTALLIANAFKNHFYYFQIKHRKLGCTFEEWRNGAFK